jgi:redox-sensitive bicupin YhaK (pirin superfamily)
MESSIVGAGIARVRISLRPTDLIPYRTSNKPYPAMSATDNPQSSSTASANLQIIDSDIKDLGGFSVRRVLPAAARHMVGPFIFFDHFGPTQFAPGEGVQVRPHPHIGLSTVTYLFEGEIIHRDSLGYVQAIQAEAVNLMTAGPT